MRTRTIPVIALVCVLISISAFSLVQDATSSSNSLGNFVLRASGTAYDPRHHENVDISLTIMGTPYGKQRVAITIVTRGGSVQVENYGTFTITKGHGVLIKRCHFIFLHIMITGGDYGGLTASWNLRGHVREVQDNTWPVTLSANRIKLPLQGWPVLRNLFLRGTITPD